MRTVAVVQVIVEHETLGRPGTGDERQLGVYEDFLVIVFLIDRVFTASWNVNRHILCPRHMEEKGKCLG